MKYKKIKWSKENRNERSKSEDGVKEMDGFGFM